MVRVLVVKEAPEVADQLGGPGRGVACGEEEDEVAQPGWWVGQGGDQVLASHEGPLGVGLEAAVAHAQCGVPAQLTAHPTDPGRVLAGVGP